MAIPTHQRRKGTAYGWVMGSPFYGKMLYVMIKECNLGNHLIDHSPPNVAGGVNNCGSPLAVDSAWPSLPSTSFLEICNESCPDTSHPPESMPYIAIP